MTQNEEFDQDPAPDYREVIWSIHPFRVRPRYCGQDHEAWAPSANRKAADVAESHTFKLRNMEGDIYLITPDPFDGGNVWVRNKGVKRAFATFKARALWKELVTSKGYTQIS